VFYAQGTKVSADTAAVMAIFTANVANVSEPLWLIYIGEIFSTAIVKMLEIASQVWPPRAIQQVIETILIVFFAQGTKVSTDTAAIMAIITANVANVSEP
jgi:hypothetical protein